jgi:hypothetical protein
MSAKILMFDPNRRVPPRHYTPVAMRGRLLQMPRRDAELSEESTLQEGFHCYAFAPDPMRRQS